MLYTETIDKKTLELLKSLQSKDYLNDFLLVGGTALALYVGHRKSIDLDLFSIHDFNVADLLEQIHQDYNYQIYHSAKNTLKGRINQINVDFLAHRYPLIDKSILTENYRLISEKDIVAMKLNALATSGQRSKDFVDIYFLLEKHDLTNMLDYYAYKYKQSNKTQMLKSLIYFDDVDLSDWPVIIKEPGLKWLDVKKRIEKKVLELIAI
ncbi:MAG: nucleotidyl transferase AbiEii/AbiGii toxin family protein [Bacteroidota bacterium]|nr:nucleotidyl transferase AbiEii/AbiGii toxin family protein [Bacteroidota bacterium]